MLRRFMALAFALPIPLLADLASARPDGQIHEVIGNKDDGGLNVWQYKDKSSPPKAEIGKVEGRLIIAVKNGDTVLFRNASGGGSHGVIFENARAEADAGVWHVVDGPATLHDPDAMFKGFGDGVKTTQPGAAGANIITIQIDKLKPGPENGILFACDPHSKSGATPKRSMLGVIVLDGGKDEKTSKEKTDKLEQKESPRK